MNRKKNQGGHQKQKNGGKTNPGNDSATEGEKVEKQKNTANHNVSKIAEKKVETS